MSNRLFQGVIHQMKDAIDRAIGVVDDTSVVIACSELGRIGEVIDNITTETLSSTAPFVINGQTFKSFGNGANGEYAVFVEGNDSIAQRYVQLLAVSLGSIKQYYDEKYDRANFIKNVILDNILPGDIYLKARELRFNSEVARVCMLIKITSKTDISAYDVVQNFFPDKTKDFVISINENDIALVKEIKSGIDSKDLEIRDVYAHGTVDFRDALAQSCNGAFGLLTRELGASIMEDYTEKTGLTQPIDINGIKTAAGSFNFPTDDDYMLSWAGIGQGEDLVNPCAMMVYMGAIANEGKPECPTLIKHASFLGGVPRGESLGRYLEKDTALELKGMMKNNVVSNYGEDNFYGLDIYAKSGTAETSSEESDAWFVGFTDDKDAPYAFVVWVKGGGFGSEVAAPIARSVLDKLREDI